MAGENEDLPCGRGQATPTRWAPPTTARAPTSRSSPRSPSASSCACSTSRGKETRVTLTEVDGFVRHGYLPNVEPGPALRVPRARPARPGSTGCGATPTSCSSTPTRRPSTGRCTWDEAVFGYPFGDPDGSNDADSAPLVPKSVVVNPFFDWGTDRSPRIPYHETVIYEAHVHGLTISHPEIPDAAARHLRGPRAPGDDRAPARAGRHRGRAHAGARVPQRPPPAAEGPLELLGLQHHRLPRPAPRLRGQGTGRGSQVQEFKAMVRDLHERGHRGDPRRGLQPHRRGQPHGPDALDARHRQRVLLPPRRGRPALLHGLHGHRQLAQRAQPAHAAADHGLAALLGHRDARRRVPLRPRVHAGPRVLRRRPAVACSSTSSSRTR